MVPFNLCNKPILYVSNVIGRVIIVEVSCSKDPVIPQTIKAPLLNSYT